MNLETENSSTFHAFFNNSPDGIIMLDLDTETVIQCNIAAEQMLRGTDKEIIGLTLADISPEFQTCGTSSAALAKQKINTVLKSGGLRFDWNFKGLDNEVFFCDVSFSELKQGTKTFLICALRDISALKKRVEDLENLNDRFNLVIKGSDVGIWQWDLVTGELIWSDQLFRSIGYDPQEMCPSFSFWEQIIHPDDLSRVMDA